MEGQAMRWSLAALGSLVGFYVSVSWLGELSQHYAATPGAVGITAFEATALVLAGVLVGAAFGFGVGPALCRVVLGWLGATQARLARAPAVDILAGATGAIIGLVIAYLLSPALGHLAWVIRAAVSVILGYLGWSVFVNKREEWLRLWTRGATAPAPVGGATGSAGARLADGRPKILDTSAIIDGRIVDLVRTGFLEGQLVVPPFVLDELRHMADSADEQRRQRGRYGLDTLNTLTKEVTTPIAFDAGDPDPGIEVDAKLVLVARELGGHVVTTDYNLSKVAELQGVSVLNVHALADALRPHLLRGERLTVRIVEAGTRQNQGIGYLEDGTMVVVEGAKRYRGEDVEVVVTTWRQNPQGRMVFGELAAGRPLQSATPS